MWGAGAVDPMWLTFRGPSLGATELFVAPYLAYKSPELIYIHKGRRQPQITVDNSSYVKITAAGFFPPKILLFWQSST